MVISCADGNEIISIWWCGLTIIIVAPADYAAVGLEGKRMAPSRADGDEIVSIRRRRLTVIIVAPADN